MIQKPKSPKKATANRIESKISKSNLLRLRTMAVRSGAWFRALVRIDRVLVDLALRVVARIQSGMLTASLMAVMDKLENALKNKIELATERCGFQLARRLSLIGEKLGNVSARAWAFDSGFARFLAVMHLNNPNMVRT